MLDYDKLASDYARHRGVNPEVLKGLLATSEVSASSKVLEVGCGTGNYTVAIETAVGCSCWGVDPSQEMLSRARVRSESIDLKLGSAEFLDFPANFFDLVFSVDVIHHVADRAAYFQEAHRVLRASANVCTVTDSEWIIRNRPLSLYFPETVEVELRRYPRIGVLRKIMARAGFRQISETMVETHDSLSDIQPYRDKAFSSLHLISEEAFQRGIERMERELLSGPILRTIRYLLLWGAK